MKTCHIKNILFTLALFSLVSCTNIERELSQTANETNLRDSAIQVTPSILRSNITSTLDNEDNSLPESNKSSVLKMTNVPDLGGINQVLDNIESILISEQLNFSNILKLNVYLTDLNDFTLLNNIFIDRFESEFPARSVVQVSKLPKDSKIEIDTICFK